MSNPKNIKDELNNLGSNLPENNKKPAFEVPEGYFEGLAASVLSKIKNEPAVTVADELKEISPVLAGISRQMPFSVPPSYFSGLEKELCILINDDIEIPGLAETGKQMPYQVPKDYFTTLPNQILEKVQEKKQRAKVITFNTRRFVQYAAAAVITGIVAISGFLYFNNDTQPSIDPATQSEAWVESKLKNVSTEALDEFIDDADVSLRGQQIANNQSKKPDVSDLLEDVSNKELDMFLNQVTVNEESLNIN